MSTAAARHTVEVYHCAKIAHEVNKAYCESIGDFSQIDWQEAQQWQKDSSIRGVTFILNNPTATPQDTHENWLNDKLEDGWTYGATKDVEKKTHPCCLPYDQLPATQRAKDHLFRAVVSTFFNL